MRSTFKVIFTRYSLVCPLQTPLEWCHVRGTTPVVLWGSEPVGSLRPAMRFASSTGRSVMSSWPSILVLFLAAVVTALPASAEHTTYFNYNSPVTQLAKYEFTQGETLGIVSGAWSSSGGTFNSTSTATSIATINGYEPEEWDYPELPDIDAGKFWYRARMLNELSGSATRVGLIYLYKDRSNFSEVS